MKQEQREKVKDFLNHLDSKKHNSHMDPKFKEAMKLLYDEVQNVEGSEGVKQILDLAFQMDEKGEFWKFKEVFGDGNERYRFDTTDLTA